MNYEQCPKCHGVLETDGTCSCGYGVKRRGAGAKVEKIDRTCPWNDHGNICGLVGSLSDATNGQGPWYCSRHWWQLKGYTPRSDGTKPHISYRERWYQEQGLPYEPPKLDDVGAFKCVANSAVDLYARLRAGELGPRHREPGEDDAEIAA